ncbi:MAG: anthranilate synthase component I [Alphaproteobacteria bacterium]
MPPPCIQPAPENFSAQYSHGLAQLVWVSRPADLDTPVAAMLRLKEDGRPCFLLESVEKGEIRGRYSVIGMDPDIIWRCTGELAEICRVDEGAQFKPCAQAPLESLKTLYQQSRIDIPEGLPPMAAGLIGHMGYDMVRHVEELPDQNPDTLGIPDSCFIRPRIMVIFDAVTDSMVVITPVWPEDKGTVDAAYKAACARIEKTLHKLSAPLPATKGAAAPVHASDFTSNTQRAQYDAMVAKAKEHILAGDIFQVVLSQRFSAPFPLPPFALYRALRRLNPSPFLFFLQFSDYSLVGSSPEILVRLRDGEVTIRPIAGTRKRGANPAEDRELAKDLLSDPKEISEHLMLLDLGRNDVGRVSRTGSVQTTDYMAIENYSHVMHIVSNVTGQLDPKYDVFSALMAGFPAGTVSGAPKIRAMEIIDDLEMHRRSFYGGCIGYFSSSGNLDTCIALRTGLVKDGMLHIQSGGGIVAESTAEGEYNECVNKARALMRAAEEAGAFA